MGIRSQANLGSTKTETKKSQDMTGMLFYGKVTKVYPKYHSADVELYNNQYGKLTSSASNEGKYACRILEPLAGQDSTENTIFGVSHPVQVGCYVVVGFLSNYSAQPVILGCMFPSDEKNIISSDDDCYKELSVSRLKDYKVINNSGELEIASHAGTMLSTSLNEIDEEFELENAQMAEQYPVDKTSNPLSVVGFVRTAVGNIKIVANAVKGALKLINKVGTKSAFIDFDSEGNIEIGVESGTTTSIKVKPDSIEISKGGTTTVSVDSSGAIKLSTNTAVNINATSGATVKSAGAVVVRGSSVTLSSNSTTLSL
jgi:Ribonuclease G/E